MKRAAQIADGRWWWLWGGRGKLGAYFFFTSRAETSPHPPIVFAERRGAKPMGEEGEVIAKTRGMLRRAVEGEWAVARVGRSFSRQGGRRGL